MRRPVNEVVITSEAQPETTTWDTRVYAGPSHAHGVAVPSTGVQATSLFIWY